MAKLICCFLVGWLITVSLLIFPLGNPSLSESVQGEKFYQSGQIQSAIKVWESSLENSRKTGDAIAESRILSNLSLAYQQLGEWQKAETLSQAPGNAHLKSEGRNVSTADLLIITG